MKSRGFTLIEVLVALTVFAVVATALVTNAAQSAAQTRLIRDKTLAHFIAENELHQLRRNVRVDEDFPTTGTRRSEITMAARSWEIEVEIDRTENELVRRATVLVTMEGEEEPLVSLSGFVGRH